MPNRLESSTWDVRYCTMRPRPPRLTARPTQRIGLAPSGPDPYLLTPAHRKWSSEVLKRANYRCQDPDHDPHKPRSGIWLAADHIVERRDGGSLTDPGNGIARCQKCHALKTQRERVKRLRS